MEQRFISMQLRSALVGCGCLTPGSVNWWRREAQSSSGQGWGVAGVCVCQCSQPFSDWHHGIRLMREHLLAVVNGKYPLGLHKTQVGILHQSLRKRRSERKREGGRERGREREREGGSEYKEWTGEREGGREAGRQRERKSEKE